LKSALRRPSPNDTRSLRVGFIQLFNFSTIFFFFSHALTSASCIICRHTALSHERTRIYQSDSISTPEEKPLGPGITPELVEMSSPPVFHRCRPERKGLEQHQRGNMNRPIVHMRSQKASCRCIELLALLCDVQSWNIASSTQRKTKMAGRHAT